MGDYLNKSVNANMINGLTTLIGNLVFLEDGIVYKAKSVNSILVNPKILYKEIAEVKARNTLRFVPKQARINSPLRTHIISSIFLS